VEQREREEAMDDGKWPEDNSYWPPVRACWFTGSVERYWKTYGEYMKYLRASKVISLEEYRRKKKEREEKQK
jgi:hypothetical protein